jgi:hypothetical protein
VILTISLTFGDGNPRKSFDYFYIKFIAGKISPANKKFFHIHPVGASIVHKEKPKVLGLRLIYIFYESVWQ